MSFFFFFPFWEAIKITYYLMYSDFQRFSHNELQRHPRDWIGHEIDHDTVLYRGYSEAPRSSFILPPSYLTHRSACLVA